MAELYWIRTPEMTDMWTQGYIGMSTISAKVRWSAHRAASKDKAKAHLPIYRALRKYGTDNVVMSVIVVGDDAYIATLEEKLRPHTGIGWNCAMGGQDPGKGRVQSAEEKEKRASKIRGRKHTEEVKKRMSEASKGKPKSEAHKQACRVANLGKKRSQDTKDRQKGKMLGRSTMTPEGKARLSEYHKNLQPWEHAQSNELVWCYAGVMHTMVVDGKITSRAVAKMLNIKDSMASVLCSKLCSGWEPFKDPKWLLWKSDKDLPALTGSWKIGDALPPPKTPVKFVRDTPLLPWNGARANKSNWARCREIRDWLDQGVKPKTICEILNINPLEKPLDTIFKKIKSGWNPELDTDYLVWLANYNMQKELHESTQSS